MDKIWWNELWMGYPVDESYSACSNVDNAHLLSRPLMLVVGELDDNVDPASTMQVANALIKANKDLNWWLSRELTIRWERTLANTSVMTSLSAI